ncbi:cysteine hydrolase [Picrophilus oshimae]|uniref:Isochorismatase n=1 Tax=Picrophilus torridus (strain ATCC 700027 / DSM 9790 / JCM 10055 / NBRC 100828 / KAW 2/3) TaxID=1122961 RepID=Q6L1E6_PICTO|nr:cysteine hydrolase [Picrophilus oshimae]AAT43206.1 isochorismatase [Picrophilus oshimae DSM 9789]
MRYPGVEKSIIIFINNDMEFFNNIFSKMEIIMALDYINHFVEKYKIPVISTRRPINYSTSNPELMEFKMEVDKRRLMGKVPESPMDKKFADDFTLKRLTGDDYSVFKEDIFYKTNLDKIIKEQNKIDLLLCGFFTDTDVFISAVSAYIKEFNVYIISDATSTYSERLYFQSLEMLSYFGTVIDTRDMEKYF